MLSVFCDDCKYITIRIMAHPHHIPVSLTNPHHWLVMTALIAALVSEQLLNTKLKIT